MTGTPETLQPLIRDAFLGLADVLGEQPADAWDSESLCERWLVRNVVAHMSTAARYTAEEFVAEVATDGGDFNRTIDRIAERDGHLDPAWLLSNLRDERLHAWIPPGGGEHGALNHVVIHSLDITVPLGIDHEIPEDTWRIVLDSLTAGGIHTHFGVDLDGVEVRADDLDWSWGEGRLLSGIASDVALALCGRRIDASRLSGALG